MTTIIRIERWQDFQHYRDGRTPPWIKLHQDLLQSRTWVSCDDADRVLAVALMLIAARTKNEIPNDPDYLQRVAYLSAPPDLSNLLALGFIRIEDSEGNAVDLQDEKPAQPKAKRAQNTAVRFPEFWEVHPMKKNKKKTLEIWKRRNLDRIADTIIADVKMRRESDPQWLRDGGAYIPHPTTYLNGDRWEDAMAKSEIRHSGEVGDLEPGRRW